MLTWILPNESSINTYRTCNKNDAWHSSTRSNNTYIMFKKLPSEQFEVAMLNAKAMHYAQLN